jgi:Ca-activated chloride channel family protein
MKMLVQELGENDRVAIVVYAGASGVALPSTSCDRKAEIVAKIDELAAQGSTNGAEGIQLAYQIATANFIKGGTNRVILATDGDFNVGITKEAELIALIRREAKTGVFLSVLGVGEGNLKDGRIEQLADKGNGNYAYLDSLNEAHKVLVRQMGATLDAIAKDVKIQVEFNPAVVASYRLVGYENRMLAAQDFADDTKDAGEIGAGHSVTALYELIPAGREPRLAEGIELRYARKQKAEESAPADAKDRETLTVKLRFKKPDGDVSSLIERPVTDDGRTFDKASTDFRFAAAVASFAMLLRDSPDKGRLTYGGVLEIAQAALGDDRGGYRKEFLELVRRAQQAQ